MYRNFRQLREGWTKNLALLFPNPGWLAARTLLWWGLAWGGLFWPLAIQIGTGLTGQKPAPTEAHNVFVALAGVVHHWWWDPIVLSLLLSLAFRLNRANFTSDMTVLGAVFGTPMFAYLLLHSKRAHAHGSVTWRGRTYGGEGRPTTQTADRTPTATGRLS
jgi:hypothetical protein